MEMIRGMTALSVRTSDTNK
ncbi:unnamed protein product, partial [Timema podura]|nr:unnamed protein product [Timema podura]